MSSTSSISSFASKATVETWGKGKSCFQLVKIWDFYHIYAFREQIEPLAMLQKGYK